MKIKKAVDVKARDRMDVGGFRWECVGRCLRGCNCSEWASADRLHHRFYTDTELQNLIDHHGFEVIREDKPVVATGKVEHSIDGKTAWIAEERCEALRQFDQGQRVRVTVEAIEEPLSKATEGEK